MRARDRMFAVAIAIPGAICCLAALILFIGRIVRNDLIFAAGTSAQDIYLGLGDAYSGGFVTGFFLCFFLMVLAIAFGTFFEQRRVSRERIGVAPRAVRSN